MPRSTVVLTPAPLDGDTVVAAAGAVWATGRGLDADADAFEVRAVDGGALLQVLAGGVAVLSVLRPRLLPTTDELVRLLPRAAGETAGAQWWGEAYTPWGPGGEIGVAILDEAARLLGGRAWTADLSATRRDGD